MKKIFSFLTLTLFSFAVTAQETATKAKSFMDDPFNDPLLPLYIVSFFVLVVILLVAFVAIYLLQILNILADQAEQENARKLSIPYAPRQSMWSRFIDKLNAAVPVEKEKDIELDHNYDGIKELDNHLPPWWTWLFIGCIVWGAVYLVVYHISDTFPLQLDEYQQELTVADEQARKLKASQPQEVIDENALVFTNDNVIIEKGKSVFVSFNCASCHKADGGGNTIGPNLTDEYWIHGGGIKNVFATIKNGAVDKGMPAWGKSMSPQDVKAVAFFVLSLQGTNPVGAKAAQGELYKEQILKSDTTTVKVDSTVVSASL
ncbi:MAG TPA: cbb3-type cytochrome c oxidase N-terminal domain-containing protein [Chryseolinea sp.]|nr:cbb3-type cytochrome c oxidase N-terminal domain-containing protein [Chryseolinea sp.]